MKDTVATLAERDYPSRVAYVNAVVYIAQSAANISPDLIRRVYQLFTQADLLPEDRVHGLERIFLKKSQPDRPPPEVPDKDMALSLVRDLLYVGEVSDKNRADKSVSHLVTRFRINQDQVAFLISWTQWENRLFEKLGKPGATVSEKDMPVELAKKAAALGVPLATLYFSGLAGFSAVGITSGLATLGTASGLVVLGLNPMTAGIAALIVGGIVIKKILDVVLPSTRQDAQIAEQRAQLEKLSALRRKCVRLLQEDAVFFSRGRWWEIFTRRRRSRRMAVRLLRELAASEVAALEAVDSHRIADQGQPGGRQARNWWPWRR
jgi:hypothetical protein